MNWQRFLLFLFLGYRVIGVSAVTRVDMWMWILVAGCVDAADMDGMVTG